MEGLYFTSERRGQVVTNWLSSLLVPTRTKASRVKRGRTSLSSSCASSLDVYFSLYSSCTVRFHGTLVRGLLLLTHERQLFSLDSRGEEQQHVLKETSRPQSCCSTSFLGFFLFMRVSCSRVESSHNENCLLPLLPLLPLSSFAKDKLSVLVLPEAVSALFHIREKETTVSGNTYRSREPLLRIPVCWVQRIHEVQEQDIKRSFHPYLKKFQVLPSIDMVTLVYL